MSGARRPSLFDVDELVLESDPLEDADERKHQAEAIQKEKSSEHRKRMAIERQRSEKTSRPDEVVEPHSRRQGVVSRFEGAYTFIDEAGENRGPDSANEHKQKSVFDEDLPELVHNDPSGDPGTLLPVGSRAAEEAAAKFGSNPVMLDVDALIPPPAQEELVEEKYRILCPTCGTAEYVERKAQGTMAKCSDCMTKFKVPPPPPNWTPSMIQVRHKNFNDDSPLVQNNDISEIDIKQRQRTQDILARAESELAEEEEQQGGYGDSDDFDTEGFLRRTFGFATDPIAVGLILGFSVVFAAVLAMFQIAINTDGSWLRQGITLFCGLVGPMLGLLFGLPMISAALAQLEAAANGLEKVVDWPSLNVIEQFGDVLAVIIAMIAAAMPGVILGLWLGGDLETSGRIQLILAMFGVLFLFPIIYLSILDNGGLLQLVSGDVLNSIRKAPEAWGGYYLKTLIVFVLTMVVWVILLGTGKSPIYAAIVGAMIPSLVFFTFQQLGVLANFIGQKTSMVRKQKQDEPTDNDSDEENED